VAVRVAEEYASEECVGELGEVTDVDRAGRVWIVAFRTHTLSDVYEHRIRINCVGNVFAHDRS